MSGARQSRSPLRRGDDRGAHRGAGRGDRRRRSRRICWWSRSSRARSCSRPTCCARCIASASSRRSSSFICRAIARARSRAGTVEDPARHRILGEGSRRRARRRHSRIRPHARLRQGSAGRARRAARAGLHAAGEAAASARCRSRPISSASSAPTMFVVGYGMDVAHSYRELPFIGHVVTEARRRRVTKRGGERFESRFQSFAEVGGPAHGRRRVARAAGANWRRAGSPVSSSRAPIEHQNEYVPPRRRAARCG